MVLKQTNQHSSIHHVLGVLWVPPDISRLSLITRSGGERSWAPPSGWRCHLASDRDIHIWKGRRVLPESLPLSPHGPPHYLNFPLALGNFSRLSRDAKTHKSIEFLFGQIWWEYARVQVFPHLHCLQSMCKLCKAQTLNRSWKNFPIALDSGRTMN